METDFDISKLTSFKIGGRIRKVYFPRSKSEFVKILNLEPDAKVFGNLSNTLISSDGYDGVLIVTKYMTSCSISGNRFTVEAGVSGPLAAQIAQHEGFSGFEFMIGFPGSIGGNICMNASAHGQCISDNFVSAECYVDGNIQIFSKEDMLFEYRKSICQNGNIIVLSADFELIKSSPDNILSKMQENLLFRKTHQPSLALPNCGSVFKNPEGTSAGKLLDSVGAKQMTYGGVHVWENHANFIVNTNKGTSLDVLKLMYKMSSAVNDMYNIKLEPEVKYLGNNNKEEDELWSKIK